MDRAKKERNKRNLLEGSISRTLIRLALPMLYGIVAIMLFNLVDTIYVGQLGTTQLAAMGFTFPVTFIMTSITLGLGIGVTSVISRFIGRGDMGRVRRLATDSLILSLAVVIIIAVIGFLSIGFIFPLLGAGPSVMGYITDYMSIWYFGSVFLVLPMVGNSAIRATGDTKTPSVIMIFSAGLNIILDPLLIFGIGPFPRMELRGAALATVIAWFVSFFLIFWVLAKKDRMLDFHLHSLRSVISSWKRVLYVGVPAAGTNMLIPLSTAIIIRYVSDYGEHAVAAYGVGVRLESLALIGVIALSTALVPIVGQNYGAKKWQRALKAIYLAMRYSLVWGIGAAFLLFIFAYPVGRVFNSDAEVIRIIAYYLFIIPVSYGCYGIATLAASSFNAINKPLQATLIVSVRLFGFAVPFAIFGSFLFGLYGIFIGVSVGNILIGIIAVLWVRWRFPRESAVSSI